MSETEQDLNKQKNLGKRLQEGTLSLADSDRPENVILAGLRMIGSIEQRGEDEGIGFKLTKKLTILIAKSRMWTPDQIQDAIDEGKRIEELVNSEVE